jgi:hypothetical protein
VPPWFKDSLAATRRRGDAAKKAGCPSTKLTPFLHASVVQRFSRPALRDNDAAKKASSPSTKLTPFLRASVVQRFSRPALRNNDAAKKASCPSTKLTPFLRASVVQRFSRGDEDASEETENLLKSSLGAIPLQYRCWALDMGFCTFITNANLAPSK